MEEIVKLVIVVVVLITLIGVAVFFIKGGGTEILSSIKNFMRFGK